MGLTLRSSKKDIMKAKLNYLYSYTGKARGVDPDNAREYIRSGWVPAPKTVLIGRKKVVRSQLKPFPHLSKNLPTVLEKTLLSSMGSLKGLPRTMMFSGGFDSTLMVLLARRYGAQVKAVTIQFDKFNPMTVGGAVSLAKKLGLSHQVLHVTAKEFLNSFELVSQITEEPLLDLDLALVNAVFKKYHQQRGKEVFISGMGSDQWFGNMALEPEYGGLQTRLDTGLLNKKAHDQVAELYGNRFIFPFLSAPMLALSLRLTDDMKDDKKLLRTLADGNGLNPQHGREEQVPGMMRKVVVKAFAQRAWPWPLSEEKQQKTDDQTLRQIALGLWLKNQKVTR